MDRQSKIEQVIKAFDNPHFKDGEPFAVFVETYEREMMRQGLSLAQDKVYILLLALKREGVTTVGEARRRIRELAAKLRGV